MRSFLVTSAFCKSKLLSDCLEHLYRTPMPGVTHVVIDNHYPINQFRNQQEIRNLCQEYGCLYFDSGVDLGWHRAANRVIDELKIQPEDLFILCDPDDRPSPKFTEAFKEVILADPEIAVAAMNFTILQQRQSQEPLSFAETEIAGHRAWIHTSVEMFTVSAYPMRFIDLVGGFDQPNPYYGGLESYLYSRWKPLNKKLVYLRDFTSDAVPVYKQDPLRFDADYRKWKDAHITGFSGSFADYINSKSRGSQ